MGAGTGKPLTDKDIKSAQPGEKRWNLKDTDGLSLEVMPSGSKIWRYRYSFKGEDTRITFGEYPLISLKEARLLRDEARLKKMRGENPIVKESPSMTLGQVYEDFMRSSIDDGHHSPHYVTKYRARTERYILPPHGKRPIKDITTQDVLSVLRPVESEGKLELVSRLKQIYSSLFRYAMVLRECNTDPTYALRIVLRARRIKHYPRITDLSEVGALMRAICGYKPTVVRNALLMHAYTFVRPGELRKAEWSEFDFNTNLWKIPKEKMKTRRPHVVPLSRQCLDILGRMKLLTGHGRYVFPTPRSLSASHPMSENGELAALRALGYAADVIVPHGFRGTASTLLNENNWESHLIERQLAHEIKSGSERPYNAAEYIPQRSKMIQWWADYLDSLRDGQPAPKKPTLE